MSFNPLSRRSTTAGMPEIDWGSSTPFRTIRSRPARSVIRMSPPGRNASAHGRASPGTGTTRIRCSNVSKVRGVKDGAESGGCCAQLAAPKNNAIAMMRRQPFNEIPVLRSLAALEYPDIVLVSPASSNLFHGSKSAPAIE